jgi:hypothetical protein
MEELKSSAIRSVSPDVLPAHIFAIIPKLPFLHKNYKTPSDAFFCIGQLIAGLCPTPHKETFFKKVSLTFKKLQKQFYESFLGGLGQRPIISLLTYRQPLPEP